MIDLPENQLTIVREILRQFVGAGEAFAFGSRVMGTAQKHSDLDILIHTPEKPTFRTMRQLREAFEDSTLPIRVDVLDWHRISPEFRAIIESQAVPLF